MDIYDTPVSEFCAEMANRRRCVLTRGHGGGHELQPVSSEAVRAIERQELTDLRLMRRPIAPDQVTGPMLLSALDEAVVAAPGRDAADPAVVTPGRSQDPSAGR